MSVIDAPAIPSAPDACAPADHAPAAAIKERRRKRRRLLRRGLAALVTLVALVGAALALRPPAVPVDLARLERAPLVVAVEESGVTRIQDPYSVSAPVTGSLSRVLLEPGDPVERGDVLVELTPTLPPLLDQRSRAAATAELEAAVAALGRARAEAERARAAHELAERDLARDVAVRGSIAPQALERSEFTALMRREELESARYTVRVAERQVQRARAALDSGRDAEPADPIEVTSPVAGTVLRVHRRSAGLVEAGAPLIEIGDPASLEVVVDLLTTDAVQIEPGTPATVAGWGSGRTLTGEVTRVEPSAFTKPSALGVDEQRVNVIIALTSPRREWLALGDGFRVEARIVLWQARDVPQLPLGAVFRHGDDWAVFRDRGGRAELTRVELGRRGDTHVEVLWGLEPGDAVVVHPSDQVEPGARLTLR